MEQFLGNLNNNDRNIQLTWNIDAKKLEFLDLEIIIEEDLLITKTHFKEVSRNSYLPITSCHHKPWLFNIPKGQLVRIRRNCTKDADFNTQANLIGQRFVTKGYEEAQIRRHIQSIQTMDRKQMIHAPKKAQPYSEVPSPRF